MVEGRDRVCWRRGSETPFVRAFLDDRAGDPRLLPLAAWSDIADAEVFYVSVIGTSEQVTGVYRRLLPRLGDCFVTVGPDRYHPDQTWFELSSRQATKAAATARLVEALDVSELVVFGDNLNDVPLFAVADRAFAVANGVPEVLAMATGVVPSNDEDGVAAWLTENVLTSEHTTAIGSCGECGFDWTLDPGQLATRCETMPGGLHDILGSAEDPTLRHRPASRTWSPIEYAAHLGEAIRWYLARLQLVLEETLPEFEAFDFHQAAVDGAYNDRELSTVLGDFETACGELAQIVRSMTSTQLARPGLGSDGTPRTAGLLLSRAEHELVHHRLDIARALNAAWTTSGGPLCGTNVSQKPT